MIYYSRNCTFCYSESSCHSSMTSISCDLEKNLNLFMQVWWIGFLHRLLISVFKSFFTRSKGVLRKYINKNNKTYLLVDPPEFQTQPYMHQILTNKGRVQLQKYNATTARNLAIMWIGPRKGNFVTIAKARPFDCWLSQTAIELQCSILSSHHCLFICYGNLNPIYQYFVPFLLLL